MKSHTLKKSYLSLLLSTALLPAISQADEACVALGGLIWDNWTQIEAGGTGSPPSGEKSLSYVRCASCHGWDRLGGDGAYAKRVRTATRPNTGLGDGDPTSRNIDTGSFGKHAPITPQMILHKGTGRSVKDGSGSWVDYIPPRNITNGLTYLRGYTLGNQHPDYSGLLSDTQVNCLVEFLNSPDTQIDKVFKKITPSATPITFEIVDSASASAGKAYYDGNCTRCHGEPTNDQSKTSALHPAGGFISYLQSDGRFSEFAHRVRWGLPNTEMVPRNYGNPKAQDIANLAKYLQDLGKFESKDKCGKSVAIYNQNDQSSSLHIPRIKVVSPNGNQDYWATLKFSKELSVKGNPIFELTDSTTNSGACQ